MCNEYLCYTKTRRRTERTKSDWQGKCGYFFFTTLLQCIGKLPKHIWKWFKKIWCKDKLMELLSTIIDMTDIANIMHIDITVCWLGHLQFLFLLPLSVFPAYIASSIVSHSELGKVKLLLNNVLKANFIGCFYDKNRRWRSGDHNNWLIWKDSSENCKKLHRIIKEKRRSKSISLQLDFYYGNYVVFESIQMIPHSPICLAVNIQT